MPKLIFFDIDGTLWDEHMEIPESTRVAIEKLKENGHKTFLCSGRARGNIQDERLLALGFDGIVAACGNHVEMEGKVLFSNLISPERVREIVEVLDACHMPVVLEGPKKHWISKHGFEEDPFVAYLFEKMQERAVPLDGYTEDIEINKFSADVLPTTDYDTIKREISKDFDILEHTENVVEFVPKGSSKATGIQWVCDYLQVPLEDTYAIGDSINDLDMLQYVGHGIAMGNATKPAMDAAEYVTTDIHEDGLYLAMEHYGLI